MFEKLRKRNTQKMYKVLVGRMSEKFNSFKNAVEDSDDLTAENKADLINFYWGSIDIQLRLQSLENKYQDLCMEYSILSVMSFVLFVLLIGCMSGGM